MKPEAFAHVSCMCSVQQKERFSSSYQNLNVHSGVKGHALGTRLKYLQSANDRTSLPDPCNNDVARGGTTVV